MLNVIIKSCLILNAIACRRYFVSQHAQQTHEATKPHKRQVKDVMGAQPHDQREADWAGGLGAPDNGGISVQIMSSVADITL